MTPSERSDALHYQRRSADAYSMSKAHVEIAGRECYAPGYRDSHRREAIALQWIHARASLMARQLMGIE